MDQARTSRLSARLCLHTLSPTLLRLCTALLLLRSALLPALHPVCTLACSRSASRSLPSLRFLSLLPRTCCTSCPRSVHISYIAALSLLLRTPHPPASGSTPLPQGSPPSPRSAPLPSSPTRSSPTAPC